MPECLPILPEFPDEPYFTAVISPVINMRTILAVLGLGLAARSVAAQSDYRRAEQFLTWNTLRHVYHDQVSPTWYRDSTTVLVPGPHP